MKVSKRWIPFLMVSQIFSPAYSSVLPPESIRPRVGILRLGELKTPTQERAYELVEKRAQKWFEDLSGPRPLVQALPATLGQDELNADHEEKELNRLVAELLRGQSELDHSQELSQVKVLRERLMYASKYGSTVQRSWLAEAAAQFMKGEDLLANQTLISCLSRHPNLEIPEVAIWEGEPTAMSLRLDAALNHVAGGIKRICSLELSVEPKAAIIVVNGFQVGNQKNFHLAVGEYDFLIQAGGRIPEMFRFQCARASKEARSYRLRTALGVAQLSLKELDEVRQRHRLASLFLIQPVDDEFRFFLYSSSGRLEPLATSGPVKISQALESSADRPLPLQREKIQASLQRNALAQGEYTAISGMGTWGGANTLEDRVDASAKWYNNWKVWAVVGGVAAGAFGAYLLSRDSSVKTQTGMAIHWE